MHYNHISSSEVNKDQIASVTTKGKQYAFPITYYKLKNGKTYSVYTKDVTYKKAHVKQATYAFERTQAKLSPIRKLFSTKDVPERVKLTVTKPIK